jgi:hypothetical protein
MLNIPLNVRLPILVQINFKPELQGIPFKLILNLNCRIFPSKSVCPSPQVPLDSDNRRLSDEVTPTRSPQRGHTSQPKGIDALHPKYGWTPTIGD